MGESRSNVFVHALETVVGGGRDDPRMLFTDDVHSWSPAFSATSLAELVHTGSFTRRMVNPDRGDYTVGFRAHKDKDTFELTMTPKQEDPQHRSFYADEDGVIHANEEGPADEKSPVVK